MFFLILLFVVLPIVATWVILEKAGQPGWGAIIPIYNVICLLHAAGKSGWWVVLFCIPVVNIVFYIMFLLGLSKCFGKGTGFAIGMLFLPFIFMLILAFSDAKYVTPTPSDNLFQ